NFGFETRPNLLEGRKGLPLLAHPAKKSAKAPAASPRSSQKRFRRTSLQIRRKSPSRLRKESKPSALSLGFTPHKTNGNAINTTLYRRFKEIVSRNLATGSVGENLGTVATTETVNSSRSPDSSVRSTSSLIFSPSSQVKCTCPSARLRYS